MPSPTLRFAIGVLATLSGWAYILYRRGLPLPDDLLFWRMLAGGALALAGWLWLSGVRLGPGSPLRAAWHVGLGAVWGMFWLLDLRHARFQLWVAAVLLSAALVRWCWPRLRALPWLAAWSLLWGALVLRGDNGCTGVSAVFSLTQLLTGLLVFFGGPFVVAASPPPRSMPGPGLYRPPVEAAEPAPPSHR